MLLKPLGCCQGPQPGQGCCAEPSLGELLLFAPATSSWGRIPQLQWKHHTCCSCCCLGGTKHWCRRAGGMAGGGQPAVGSSFFPCNSIYWRVGSCPLWAENAPLQHGVAGQTPQPVQEQLEPPGHSLAPPHSQKFTLVNQEEQEAELC